MKKFFKTSGLASFLYFTLAASVFLTAFQTSQQVGGIPPIIWIILIIVLVAILWLYFRSRQPAPPPPPAAYQPPSPPPKADDLTIIEGIGPKIASVLQAAGITTFNQLAAMDVGRLREILEQGGIHLVDPRTWAEQARLAAASDMDGLKALQDRLNAGRVE
jgi:hypothetical protein